MKKWSVPTIFSKNLLTDVHSCGIISSVPAGMAELADALDSGSSESNFMQVQVLFLAPYRVFITNLRVG